MTEATLISSHWVALIVAIVLSSISQLMLRAGSMRKGNSPLASLLNPKVLIAYLLFLIVVILMIYAMQEITLRTASTVNSLTFVIVPILAHMLLKEAISARLMLGSTVITVGVIIFML